MSERDRRLFGPGPKRILALDGGGVRGIISLGLLERLERLLGERAGRPVVLADYFDLIGGTSTGAILATGLALGMPVAELIELYLSLSKKGFRGARFHGGVLIPKFRTAPLLAQIKRQVGEETLGSARLRTGLAMVAKRIDTGSVWLFHNNPRGAYFDAVAHQPGSIANRELKLAQLIRASTAAPTFFQPERIEVARGVEAVFVDGGVSPHNNPALLLVMLATLQGYGIGWPTGQDRLMLTSVGTGHRPLSPERLPSRGAPAAALAVLALRSMIEDGSQLVETMLQWLGTSPAPRRIDGEVGDLAGDQLGPAPQLHYLRYDLEFTPTWMKRVLGLDKSEAELARLDQIDRPELAPELLDLARTAAERLIDGAHLPAAFDGILNPAAR